MTTQLEVEHIPNTHIDNAQKPLITALELALVKDLNGDDRRLFDHTARNSDTSKINIDNDVHVETFVPVRVQSLLDDTRRDCLLGVDGDNRKWVWKPEHISLRQTVGRDDCRQLPFSISDICRGSSIDVPVILIFLLSGSVIPISKQLIGAMY